MLKDSLRPAEPDNAPARPRSRMGERQRQFEALFARSYAEMRARRQPA